MLTQVQTFALIAVVVATSVAVVPLLGMEKRSDRGDGLLATATYVTTNVCLGLVLAAPVIAVSAKPLAILLGQ